ncbi:MAG: heparan-alpha-glucosaminide N-acetyltransferase domain-containing protein [Christensenellaceae bacterium]|jgi:hypothetical protein|nr:heparan-alpha-glucosaminide N-acetyltransferase domain-containing protein [Christensenellaceae bacterium]
MNQNKIFNNRIALIDNIRGLLVLAFIFLHVYVDNTDFRGPEWLVHNGKVADIPIMNFANVSVMDFGPTSFFFVIGLTVFLSFSKRIERSGKKAAYSRYLLRNAVLFSACKIILFIKSNVTEGEFIDWDNISSIAFTGFLLMLFMFDFIRNKPYVRLVLGAIVLVLYHVLKEPLQFLSGAKGGIYGCLGYLGIVLVSSFIVDLARESLLKHAIFSFILFIIAWLVNTNIGKPVFSEYNMPYMVMSIFALNSVYFIFSVIDKLFLKGREIPILAPLGKSLIFFLYLTFIIDAIFYYIPEPLTRTQVFIVEAILIPIYLLIGYFLGKKRIIIKL